LNLSIKWNLLTSELPVLGRLSLLILRLSSILHIFFDKAGNFDVAFTPHKALAGKALLCGLSLLLFHLRGHLIFQKVWFQKLN
jgi:hypothetical protein